MLMDPRDLEIIKIIDNHQEILKLTFSPDSNFLFAAIAPPSNFVNVYSVPSFALRNTFGGSSVKLCSIDISQDNTILMTTNERLEQFYYDIQNQVNIPNGEVSNNLTEFDTFTGKIGWQMQAIWDQYEDMNCISSVEKGDNIVAVGDIYGRIRIYRWPPIEKNQGFVELKGQGCPVTCLRFSLESKSLVATYGDFNLLVIY